MTPEATFRIDLDKAMVGLWLMTWHEDREISPGVPDCAYVMNGGRYETGWLELKAIRNADPPYSFKLEPSQHRWIEAHHAKIPVHFLLATGKNIWLIPGAHHRMLTSPVSIEQLRLASICECTRESLRATLYNNLRDLTDRGRNGI